MAKPRPATTTLPAETPNVTPDPTPAPANPAPEAPATPERVVVVVPDPAPEIEASNPAAVAPAIGPITFEKASVADESGRTTWTRHHAPAGLIADGVVYVLGPVPVEWPSAPDHNGETTTIRGTSTGLVPVADSRPVPAEGAR